MDRTNQWLSLVANIGVIAGLFFLAYEIRQNTNIAKASAYRENVQDIAQWRELTILNPEVARIWGTYLDDGIGALERSEAGRAAGIVNNIVGSYENAFFARNYGIIGDDEWQRFEVGACIHWDTAQKNELNLRFITEEFRQFLKETCE